MTRLAVFVSPHGFGHAARVSAVLYELLGLVLDLEVQLLTTVPEWFFADSLPMDRIEYCSLACDLGLVQHSSLEEDLGATVAAAAEVLDFSPRRLARVVAEYRLDEVDAVLADIAPLGLAIAAMLDKPSILLESFTWSFIYRGYASRQPELTEIASRLDPLWAGADLRIQTEPWCELDTHALQVGAVARRAKASVEATRDRLELDGRPAILLTMGGIGWSWDRLDRLSSRSDLVFVVPGAARSFESRGNLRLMPHRSGFHHPDLVAACDLVIGKLGYSTAAEAVSAGRPFLFIPRPGFPETESLAAWCAARGGMAIEAESASSLSFVDRVDRGLELRVPEIDRSMPPARSAAVAVRGLLREASKQM